MWTVRYFIMFSIGVAPALCAILVLGALDCTLADGAKRKHSPTSGAGRALRRANVEHWRKDSQWKSNTRSTSREANGYQGVSIDKLLEKQRLERSGTQWQWEKDSRVPTELYRHANVLLSRKSPVTSTYGFIEVTSAQSGLRAPVAKVPQHTAEKKMSKVDAKQKEVATSGNSGTLERSRSDIVPPQWEHHKARFTEVGAEKKGADPWWLNPPPWWLPPPPEWGSPPPSVYSPFYSPASIQQPFYNSPSHNSYPAYTPRPPPYRFIEVSEKPSGWAQSAYLAKRRLFN